MKDIEKKSNSEIAKLLRDEDHDAWNYVFLNAANPVMCRENIRLIMLDRNLSRLDVYGFLYEEMIARGKINTYKDAGGSILGWMKWHVYGLIHKYCRKNPWPVSDDAFFNSYQDRSTSCSTDEDWEVVQKCFRELWKENPMRAYVHLLWVKSGLKPQEIMKILGMSSVDNVYKMHERAEKDMQAIRDAYMKDIIE